ncbi:MAG: hypothetical protein RLZZ179_363 [Verrucomicrobiota bacterium]|jgi:hypothetical protein
MKTTLILSLGALATAAMTAHAGTDASYGGPAVGGGPVAPVASDISYNLLEVNWLHTEWDVVGLDSSDGVGLNLSYSPVQSLYITAGGSWQQVDTARDSADLWTANVGLGGYIPLTSNIHFVTEVGAAFYGFDNSPIGSDDESSLYVRPHFRGRWGNFEAHAGAAWTNADITNEWAGFGRLYFGITPNWDLAAGISAGKNETTVNAGVRLRY